MIARYRISVVARVDRRCLSVLDQFREHNLNPSRLVSNVAELPQTLYRDPITQPTLARDGYICCVVSHALHGTICNTITVVAMV